MLPTPLLARMKLSVPINGVFVALAQVAGALRRFCTPALFHHENQNVFDLSSAGSALLFRYRGRNLALCTYHQLGKGLNAVRPEQFMIMADGGKTGLAPNRVSRVRMEHPEHENLEDIFLAEYADDREGRDLRPFFLKLDLGMNLGGVQPESVQAIFAIGFPTFAREPTLEIDDDGEPTKWAVQAHWVKLYLARSENQLLDTENRTPMVQDGRADQEAIDPDGMSGAPVFFVGLTTETNAFLGFSGMITHALGQRYMVYDASHLKTVVDRYIDDSL